MPQKMLVTAPSPRPPRFLGFGHIIAELPRDEVVSVIGEVFWDDHVLVDRTGATVANPGAWDEAYWKQ